jgi:protocatechuate 3,4-dioxygenase beta subunit
MPEKIRIKIILLMPFFIALLLQGCSVSEEAGTPAGTSTSPRLSLTTSTGSTTLVADGTSSVPIRLTATDSSGRGIPNTMVVFTTTAGSLSASTGDTAARRSTGAALASTPRANGGSTEVAAVTDANGVAEVILTSSTRLETAKVIAEVLGFSIGLTVEFVAGPPAALLLSATPNTLNGGDTATIEATVTDANDNPVSGVTITFTISTNNSGASLVTSSGITDANGQVSVVYIAGSNSGTDAVSAGADGIATTVAISVEAGAGLEEDIASITLITGATTLVADGVSSAALRATVLDGSGQGIPGIAVTFTTTAGTIKEPSEVLTNANGVAITSLVAATKIGTATVRASTSGFGASVTVTFVAGAPAEVQLSATPQSMNSGVTSVIQATVTDSHGNPTPSETLTFTFSENNSGASLDPVIGVTDANGRVSVTYTAGPNPGTDTIRAEATNGVVGEVTVTVQAVAVAASIELLVSSPQLDSDGSETVTLTALVRDANNNFVEGALVNFSADSGGIQVVNNLTDTSGTATALLSTAGDPTNRPITVMATTDSLLSTNVVNVTGTTVTLSGTSALVLGETTTLSILLRDSGGKGIADQTVVVSSALGNTLSNPTPTTDSNGQATFTVTADVAGTDTITASALGATGALTLAISAANFVFTTPAAGAEVRLGEDQEIVVHWDEAGVPQGGQTINFFATRGVLSAASATTDGNGDARVTISSANAGPAAITATATAADGPSSQIEIEFVATTPTSLILQANPTTVGINAEGSTDQQSIITAIVRDASGNLVKNQTVSFTLTDVTGGSIFPPSAVTDSFGRASTVYTAGAAASAQDGVIIDAEVAGTIDCEPTDPIPSGPCDRVTLTVAQQALFVTVGTSNVIQPLSETQYAKPYSVLVTDANGNPVDGAVVELNLFPTRYQKGFYALVFDESGTCIGWGKVLTVSASSSLPNPDNADQACDNEDVNRNGLLNPGEDINNNGTLEPGNVATAPTSVTTDATGFALFSIVYAKEFTWVEVELEARTTVAGSEAFSTARFFLPGLVDDFNDCEVAPPGQLSPYGLATTCGCDELVDPTCPTISGLAPVSFVLEAGTLPLPKGGGVLTFSMTGGAQVSYNVTTTAGTLTNTTTGTTGTSIIVNFGETFTLTTGSTEDGLAIVLSATDLVTGQQGTTIVNQES